ncbi:MAG TPA: hypothetical protein VKD72_23685 [Gemmataceae bacterium]|nr:hypothetical protein [Gemmataceae bacterium]
MQVPVLIERVAENGYRARAGEPFGWSAEGATADEALGALKEIVTQKVAAGVTIVSLEVPITAHPWMKFAGKLKGHPLLEEWKQAMAEYRQEVENDPERL